GIDKPHLASASLNPHPGERLLLGDVAKKEIVPGMADAQKRLYGKARLCGRIGAETAFRLAAAKQFEGVVAMYHDQATIPMKLLDFGDAVKVTMGLTVVRVCFDQGTAYDIAWTCKADSLVMYRAIEVGAKLNAASRQP